MRRLIKCYSISKSHERTEVCHSLTPSREILILCLTSSIVLHGPYHANDPIYSVATFHWSARQILPNAKFLKITVF